MLAAFQFSAYAILGKILLIENCDYLQVDIVLSVECGQYVLALHNVDVG